MAAGAAGLSVPELIRKKRDGGRLARAEIAALVNGFTAGRIPDYQMSALLMAVYFRGLDAEETAWLTKALVASGRRLDLSPVGRTVADKHSTGGVGDKTTLVLAPLLAACGLPVAKLSGRGLGHTGGTLDKLESIPGLRVDLDPERFVAQVREVGVAIAGQTADLVPADGLLYALRDVTATVDSVPLIAASVMSKKIAGGAGVVALDVKVGRGAFMREEAGARELARAMLGLGRAAGLRVAAVLSDMDRPLGRAVGNALEVREAIATLLGEGPPDLVELCLTLGTLLLVMAGQARDAREARRVLERALASGEAAERFARLVAAQGGNPRVVEDPDLLPRAPCVAEVPAPRPGRVSGVDALAVGRAAAALGAGRRVKGEPVDPAAGVVVAASVGERVEAGQALARVHGRDRATVEAVAAGLVSAWSIGAEQAFPPPVVREVIQN